MGLGPEWKALEERLHAAGQAHVLRFVRDLDEPAATAFRAQLEGLDLPRLRRLVDTVLGEAAPTPTSIEPPADVVERDPSDAGRARDAAAREVGEELLAAGRVGAFLVAGGQGTRLGFEGPKGRFPIGPVTGRSLFSYHAHRVLAASGRYGTELPLYVMTSPANHADTLAAFEEAAWFGLDPALVQIFPQGMLPAVDREGRLLLADKGSLSMSPDGHGGCFRALLRSGALDDMESRGLEHVFYFQVDNPLAPVLDPVFIGHHAQAGAEMSTKVVEKTDPAEKVGVLARVEGRDGLVEYSDLPEELARAREPSGRLRFRAGNIAIHMLAVPFVRRLVSGDFELPVHRADKKVPHIDDEGRLVDPDEPNAVKMEMFVFDALGHARSTVAQEVAREDEFAPVKNAEGADSPETARQALVAQARRWLEHAGQSPPAGDVEIGPLFALDPIAFREVLTRTDRGPVYDRPA